MICNPKLGDVVQVWYRTKPFDNGIPAPSTWMPWHGRTGTVVVVGRPRKRAPRNHGINIDGQLVGVPAGNLRKPQ